MSSLVRLMKRVGAGFALVAPTDQITCDLSLATITPTGAVSANLSDLLGRVDSYRYKKAINANATTAAAGGVEAMLEFVSTLAGYGPGSTLAAAATQNLPALAGGDLETLVLTPWLTSLGLTPAAITSLIATLRTARLAQSY